MSFWRTLIDIISYPIRLISSVPMAFLSGPRKLWGLPLPVRVALITSFVLLISALIIFWIKIRGRGNAGWWYEKWVLLAIFSLIILIGFAVYYAVKLWLTGSQSPFPDIDQAWNQGVKALSAAGIDITNVPIFLVVGVGDDRNERHLLQASGLPFRVRDIPAGPGPLHFYASDNAVFLACTQVSRLSRFVSNPVVEGAPRSEPGRGSADLRATMVAGPAGEAGRKGGADLRGTIVGPGPAGSGGAELRGTVAPGGADLRGTVMPGGPSSRPASSGAVDLRGTMVAGAGGGSAAGGSQAPKLSPTEFSEQGERLNYLCYLLSQARQPYCPINGIMCVLPYRLIQRGSMEANEIQRAMREDLTTIRKGTRLRCPVVVLVSGMDSESGFMELIRRVGIDRAHVQRFGKGYGVWNAPTDEQMRAVATHACGAFEDTIYQLFKERDGYNKPGNGKLYQLLCKIRNDVRGRLATILAQGLGFNSREVKSNEDLLLMGGCYFAATGETEDLQAFVKSVFEKYTVENLDNELDWTPEAITEDQRYHNLSRVCYLLSAALCVVVAILLFQIAA